MMNNFDDMQKLGKENLDATVKSLGVLSKSTQSIAAEMADYSKKSIEDGSRAMEKFLSAKTVEQAVAVQTDFAKTTYEGFIAGATKIGELYVNLAKEACKPFESYVSKAAPAPTSNVGRTTMPR